MPAKPGLHHPGSEKGSVAGGEKAKDAAAGADKSKEAGGLDGLAKKLESTVRRKGRTTNRSKFGDAGPW